MGILEYKTFLHCTVPYAAFKATTYCTIYYTSIGPNRGVEALMTTEYYSGSDWGCH